MYILNFCTYMFSLNKICVYENICGDLGQYVIFCLCFWFTFYPSLSPRAQSTWATSKHFLILWFLVGFSQKATLTGDPKERGEWCRSLSLCLSARLWSVDCVSFGYNFHQEALSICSSNSLIQIAPLALEGSTFPLFLLASMHYTIY